MTAFERHQVPFYFFFFFAVLLDSVVGRSLAWCLQRGLFRAEEREEGT